MEFHTRSLDGGVIVIAPAGRLNMVTAGALRDEIARHVEGGSTRIVVDLAGVDFMDSSGLGSLISGLKSTRQAGGDLRIAAATEQVMRVLTLTNMDRVLVPHPSVETAFDDA